ncbi:ribonuclease Z [Candidatus Parvarchaeota archaeon]|nr:ribonuclease Z [Candidatus Parvarchaeota archaeon]
MIKAIALGTSSAFPTRTRNHPSIYINLAGNNMLFDCGEGTQRQIRIAGLSPSIDSIFITHWHGDHSLGVGGIIQSLNMLRREKPLEIYGPTGTDSSVRHIISTYKFHNMVKVKTVSLKLPRASKIMESKDYEVYGINLPHNVMCIGYKIKEKDRLNIRQDLLRKTGIKSGPFLKGLKQQKDVSYNGRRLRWRHFTYLKKGRSLVYMTDFSYERKLASFAKDADALLIESTFSSDMEEKALQFNHLTVRQALTLGKSARAKNIFLTHISQRYEDKKELDEQVKMEAKKLGLSGRVKVLKDFDVIEV